MFEADLDSARRALAEGNFPEAERISRNVLFQSPRAAQAHLILGLVAQRTGYPQRALPALLRSLELDPTLFEAALGLSVAYKAVGDFGSAARFALSTVRLDPTHAGARTQLGLIYLEALSLRAAEEQLRKAAELSGGEADPLFMLAQCLERRGRLDEAAETARRALNARQMPIDRLLAYIGAMIQQRCPVCAAEGATVALKLAPESLKARVVCVRALMEARRDAEALAILDDPSLAQAAETEPHDSESLAILGMALQSFGRLEEARDYLRLAVDGPLAAPIAFYAFTHCGRMTADDAWIVNDLKSRLSEVQGDATALHFALGKAYEDLGDYEQAMRQFELANGEPGVPTAPEEPFQPLSQEQLAANAGFGCESTLPIFVVGMLRSGTTLAEQILSCHPEVGGVGELAFWNDNGGDLIDPRTGSVLTDRLRDAGERYVSVLSRSAQGKTRVVDKMPGNYKSLGLIRLALPRAKVIHMRRNALDTCISIYATFGSGLDMATNTQRNLVDAYRRYRAEMDHWRSVLPTEWMLEIDYEELVQDSETVIRRMVEFCGLNWHEACLHPEWNPRSVATPSLWQVRRPINQGSIGRWRRFEPWLGALRELL